MAPQKENKSNLYWAGLKAIVVLQVAMVMVALLELGVMCH